MLNRDRRQEARWDRMQAKREQMDREDAIGPYKERFQDVVIIRDQPGDWFYCLDIRVKFKSILLLTFQHVVLHNAATPEMGWACFAGMGVSQWELDHSWITDKGELYWHSNEPKKPLTNLVATWTGDEFAEAFSQERWRESLSLLLKLIRCPRCPSWTGGGLCFGCARSATLRLHGRMA